MQRPIFCLFKELSLTANQSNERDILTQLLNEIYLKQPRIAYYFLYYMNALNMRLLLNNMDKNAHTLVNNELNTLLRIYKEFVQERHNNQQQQQSQDNVAATNVVKNDVNVKLVSDSSDNSESSSTTSSSGAISDNDDDKKDDDDNDDDDDDEDDESNESNNDFDNEASDDDIHSNNEESNNSDSFKVRHRIFFSFPQKKNY